MSVVTTTIASASGRWSTRLDWRSMKWAVNAGHLHVAGSAGRSRTAVDDVLAALAERGVPEIASISVTPPARRCGGSTAATPGMRADLVRSLGACAAVAAVDRQLDRRVAETAGSRRASRRRPGGRWPTRAAPVASTEVNLIPKNGIPSAISSAALRDRDPGRAAASRGARAGTRSPPRSGRASRSARRWRNVGESELTRVAEQGEDRRQDDQRDAPRRSARPASRRGPSSRGSAAGRRQRRERGRDRQRQKRIVRPAVGHRPPHRLGRPGRCWRSPRGSARP